MKKLTAAFIFTTALTVASTGYAAGNNNTIDLDLQGDNLNPTVTQEGDNNKAKLTMKNTLTLPADRQMRAGISQKGKKNTATLEVTNPKDFTLLAPEPTTRNNFTIKQDGEENTASVKGQVTSMDYTATQTGNRNRLSVDNAYGHASQLTSANADFVQKGDMNNMTVTGIGTQIYQGGSTLTQTGTSNSLTANNLVSATISQTGNANSANIDQGQTHKSALSITQNGSGNFASTKGDLTYQGVKVDQNGTGNTAKVTHKTNLYNGISVKQVGSNYADIVDKGSWITLDQNGGGNRFESNITSSEVGLGANVYNVKQKGNYNSTTIKSTSTGTNSGTVDQDGNSNKANITLGAIGNYTIKQKGDRNTATQIANGSPNMLNITQNGNDNIASQTINGNANSSVITQTGSKHTANIGITGNNNNFNVTQEGTGQTFNMNRVGNAMSMNIVQK